MRRLTSWIICTIILMPGLTWSEDDIHPPDSILGEQYLPDGKVPPPRELYSAPSVRALSSKRLWKMVEQSDGLVIIGLKDREPRGYFRGKILVSPKRVEALKEILFTQIKGIKPAPDSWRTSPTLTDGRRLPMVMGRVDSIATLERLRKFKFVEFVEPAIFLMDGNSLACGQNPMSHTQVGSPILLDPLGDSIPYPFTHLGIQGAWNRATIRLPGASMDIAIIDSGTSSDQDQLNAQFPFWSNSTIRPVATHLTAGGLSPGDECGHGTRMAGLAAAPRDGHNIVGIAWAAPLTTIKAVSGPIVMGGSRYPGNVLAICDAISKAASGGARVISMAFGLNYTSPTIEICIKDAYNSFPEKIFVAAAGSTFAFVVFPAEMPEVVAVSLVEIDSTSSG